MPPSRCRRFTLLDAMILVAAIAAGLAAFRAEGGNHYNQQSIFVLREAGKSSFGILNSIPGRAGWFMRAQRWSREAIRTTPVFTCLTLALLAIRLRRPRPDLRRLSCQPGFVAEVAVLATLAANLAFSAFQVALSATGQSSMTDPKFYATPAFFVSETSQAGLAGMAVLASWATLALGGRWRPERGWIDRSGLAMGLAWAALMLLHWFHNRLT